MVYKLYYHWGSEPSRAVLILIKEAKLPCEIKLVDLAKQEQQTPEFEKLNPNKLVPVLQDDDFILWESHAILRYLVTKEHSLEKYYPADPRTRATIDKWLDWHHTQTRDASGGVFLEKVWNPMRGVPTDEQKLKQSEEKLERVLGILESQLDKTKFLAGNDVSLADLAIVCELRQLQTVVGHDLSKFPKIEAWLERTRVELPAFEEVEKEMLAWAKSRQQK